jgi:hypothetical protein
MNKKLTLNIQDNLIDFAHKYSKKTNQSITAIIEKYLSRLKEETEPAKISDDAKKLYGIRNEKTII